MAKVKRQSTSPPPRRWVEDLALYNAECARGLVHTPECDARMVILQERFDKDLAQEAAWAADAHVAQARKGIGL